MNETGWALLTIYGANLAWIPHKNQLRFDDCLLCHHYICRCNAVIHLSLLICLPPSPPPSSHCDPTRFPSTPTATGSLITTRPAPSRRATWTLVTTLRAMWPRTRRASPAALQRLAAREETSSRPSFRPRAPRFVPKVSKP